MFKVGDIVEGFSKEYTYTGVGSINKVTRLDGKDIEVLCLAATHKPTDPGPFVVNAAHFKLAPKATAKKYKGVTVPVMVGCYRVSFHKGYIQVGCMKVDRATIEKIYKQFKRTK